MWQEAAERNILNVAIYIRVTGRGPFNELAAMVALARRGLRRFEKALNECHVSTVAIH